MQDDRKAGAWNCVEQEKTMRMSVPKPFLAVALAMAPAIGADAQSAAGHQFTVIMSNMNYGQVPAEAKVGDTVIWVNQDTVDHSVTARDGSIDLRLQPGKKGRTVLKKAGTRAIYCIYHPTMRTSLKVKAS
jgi:plastocyanin